MKFNFETFAALFLTIGFGLLLAGCADNDGPFEEAGEDLDEAVDDTEDALDDAADELDPDYFYRF